MTATIWSLPAALEARDAAMADVEVKSVPWRTVAREALEHLALTRPTLTSDDVWQELERRGIPAPDEARAMGPVMKAAMREGLIVHSHYTTGTNKAHHGDIMRVYRSVVFE